MYNHGMIYLDYAATTPLDERVFEAMRPLFSENFGNPSSVHRYGQRAEAALEDARESVAQTLGASASEVIFTSGGSESDNLALRGLALARRQVCGANRILTTRAEHPAVSKTALDLQRHFGFEVTWLPLDSFGRLSPQSLQAALGEDVALVSVMYANNEIGSINDLAALTALTRARGIPFHTDAVQAAAYLPLQVNSLGVDALSLGGHKFYGPKGIGALYLRRGLSLWPQITGGGQEDNRRAGTSNLPLIVGLARALQLTAQEREARAAHTRPLRDALIGQMLEAIPSARLTGHPQQRLPNHASFVFEGVDGNRLLTLLDAAGFACSSGSACKTGSPAPSETLLSLGLPPAWALGSLRITLGKFSAAADINALLKVLPAAVEKARAQ